MVSLARNSLMTDLGLMCYTTLCSVLGIVSKTKNRIELILLPPPLNRNFDLKSRSTILRIYSNKFDLMVEFASVRHKKMFFLHSLNRKFGTSLAYS